MCRNIASNERLLFYVRNKTRQWYGCLIVTRSYPCSGLSLSVLLSIKTQAHVHIGLIGVETAHLWVLLCRGLMTVQPLSPGIDTSTPPQIFHLFLLVALTVFFWACSLNFLSAVSKQQKENESMRASLTISPPAVYHWIPALVCVSCCDPDPKWKSNQRTTRLWMWDLRGVRGWGWKQFVVLRGI